MVLTPVYVNEDNVSMEHGTIMDDLQQASRSNILLVPLSLPLSEVVLEEKVSHTDNIDIEHITINQKNKTPVITIGVFAFFR